MAETSSLSFGPFELDMRSVQLRRAGRPVPLRARPLALLQAFLRRPGELLTKDALLSEAWPGVIVEENNLQVQVSVLRKLLGAGAITTLPARGYRFELPVRSGSSGAWAEACSGHDELLGRESELAQLVDWLGRERLVSLCGTGGVGKTRLAREAVVALTPQSCCWVDLAAQTDPALIAATVLEQAQGGAEPPPSAALAADRLAAWLEHRPTLLVLDNVEHLLDAVATAVASWLARHPALRILVTSRAPLQLPQEQVLRLLPLPVPTDINAEQDPGAAVALFTRRACATNDRFRLDASTLPEVVSICRRLDGLPLALELAAARVAGLGLAGIKALLDERFQLLTSARRESSGRHHALRTVYDWTYSLLSDTEQTVFRRLGVMAAPLTLDELVGLLAGPRDAPLEPWACYDALAGLVDHSLLHLDEADPPRYALLESARAYALTRLREAREVEVLDHASRWYEAAGDRVAGAAGATPALRTYATALDLLRQLPATPARDRRELALQLKLGPAQQSTLGPAHARCEATYRRSVDLARGTGPGPEAFQALWGYWHFLSLAGRDREAAPYAREIVEMAENLDDDGFELEALHAEMTSADLLGDAELVVERAQRITALYDHCRHHRLTFAFGGHDPGVCALGQGSVNQWLRGQPLIALDLARRGLDLAASLGHGYTRASAAFYAAITYAFAGDRAALARTAQALVQLSDEHGMAMLLTEGQFFLAYSDFQAGDATGLERMRVALDSIEASGDLGFVFVYMALLAEAWLAQGEHEAVIQLVDRALRHAVLGQGLFLPELLRQRALARRALGELDWARDAESALRMANQQGAKVLAERAGGLLTGLR